jgi:hypothetical protein
MKAPVRKFLIREAQGVREADTLVLGTGMVVGGTAGGLPELLGVSGSETYLQPSGGDDTQAIRDALATGKEVRLGPGAFNIAGTITLGAGGAGRRLAGSGVGRTTLRATTPLAPMVSIAAGGCAVEGLALSGYAQTGIRAVVSGPVTLRDLSFFNMDTAVYLENVVDAEVCRMTTAFVAQGIFARGISRSTLRNVTINQTLTGIRIENGTGVTCEFVSTTGEDDMSPSGIEISGGTGYRLSRVQVENCQTPVSLVGVSRATVELLSLGMCRTGILLEGVRDATLDASRVWAFRNALVVRDSENVVVGAFVLDNNLVTSPASQLIVESSAGVFFTGTRMTHVSSSLWDVDVSLAGSRVLFGPHNFIASRINSGGNFAAL